MIVNVVMPEQVTLFDLFKNEPSPKFLKGDTVFIRSLDVVIQGEIGHSWLCGNTYFGYDVDFEDGTHTVVWDYLIGDKVFFDRQSAVLKADSLHFEKILPEELTLDEYRSFEYYRKLDGHRLTATLAKIGETQLYDSGFMCYHFIRQYPNKKSRDKAYGENLSKIIEEAEQYSAIELKTPALDAVYKINDSLYASRGYAEHNGVSTER